MTCVHCKSEITEAPLYWVQKSKPQKVDHVDVLTGRLTKRWECLFVHGEDLPLCDIYCSFEYDKSPRAAKETGKVTA